LEINIQTDKPLYQPGETIWFRAGICAPPATMQAGPPVATTVAARQPARRRRDEQAGAGQGRRGPQRPAPRRWLDGGEYKLVLRADDGTADERTLIVNTYQPPRLQKSLELLREAYGAGDAVAAAVEVKQATGEPSRVRALTAIVTIDDVETNRWRSPPTAPATPPRGSRLPPTIARGDGLLTILADDGGVTESIQRRIPIVTTTLQLGLYPEGGDLIDGVPGRVYFQARTPLGKPADIEGKVVDERGATVAEFRSVHDGLGRFELTPATDRRYQVKITKPAGITSTFTVPAGQARRLRPARGRPDRADVGADRGGVQHHPRAGRGRGAARAPAGQRPVHRRGAPADGGRDPGRPDGPRPGRGAGDAVLGRARAPGRAPVYHGAGDDLRSSSRLTAVATRRASG
jgi:hypothetical protein